MQDAVDRQLVTVGLIDGPVNFGFAGEQGVDLESVAGQSADLVERDDVIDVRKRNRQPLVFGIVVEGQQVVALGQFARHQCQRRRVDNGVGEVDALLAEAFGERVAQGGFGNETEGNQQFADRLVGLHLFEQGNAQLIFAENALGDQNLAKLSLVAYGSVHRRVCSERDGRQ